MASKLVEMMNIAFDRINMVLDTPSARAVVFGFSIQGHFFVEGLMGVIILILLSMKSYKPPKRPLTEQEIDELCDEWDPEPLIPPITEDMKHEPPVLKEGVQNTSQNQPWICKKEIKDLTCETASH